jgi:hypothetical protein
MKHCDSYADYPRQNAIQWLDICEELLALKTGWKIAKMIKCGQQRIGWIPFQ